MAAYPLTRLAPRQLLLRSRRTFISLDLSSIRHSQRMSLSTTPVSLVQQSSSTIRTFVSSSRLEESGWSKSDVDYRELKPLTLTPSDDVLLVDVREVEEVVQGNIPSSVNLPLSVIEMSLDSHPDDFVRSHGFPKPSRDQRMIFYCRSGKRSETAKEIAKMKGFKNVRNYKGSWLDWIEKEKST